MHAPLCVHSLFIEGEALGEEESYGLKSLNLSGCRSIGAILKEDVKSSAPQQPGGTNDTEQGNAPESAAAKSNRRCLALPRPLRPLPFPQLVEDDSSFRVRPAIPVR